MPNGFQSNTVLNPITCTNGSTITEAGPLSKMTGHSNTKGGPDNTIPHQPILAIDATSNGPRG